MKVYYYGKPYEWQFGSESLFLILKDNFLNKEIYLKGKDECHMVSVHDKKLQLSKHHEKKKEPA